MARNKRTSIAEDLVNLVAKFPWWVGFALAIASYVYLHNFASSPTAKGVTTGQVATIASGSAARSMAKIGQYVLPAIFLLGAAVSGFRKFNQKRIHSAVAESDAAHALDNMSWREFEILVGEAFRQQGYRVTETGGGGSDGGVDLELRKGSERFLVQCKQWKAHTVGVTIVRELYGVMAAKGAAGGYVVTSGRFTQDAKSFADGRNVQLVDGPALLDWIKGAKASIGERNIGQANPSLGIKHMDASPPCPICAKSMIQRTAKRGNSAGTAFWGCSGYPACRGTRPIH